MWGSLTLTLKIIYTTKLKLAKKLTTSGTYRIVPSKRPWVLAAQAPKIEGGQLHGEGG